MAAHHALAWLVIGNAVGLWLALLLVWPGLQVGEWTYGRWVPVHLNVQLYGWTALPLVAWLLHIYEVAGSGKAAVWAPAAVWGWSSALALGTLHWLDGRTSGKIFLDWQGGALWGFVAAMVMLWLVLAAAWRERAAGWSPGRRTLARIGLFVLAAVPVAMVYVASPAVYPPVDSTTGGPTGSSLLGSTLVVVTLLLLLPRAGAATGNGRAGWGVWTYLANCWLIFGAAEWIGGTHREFHQIGAMLLLLPWAVLLPWDWAAFVWPASTRGWRLAVFGWWALLVLSGVTMYLPHLLDRVKFTHALVAHSHLAMAGFTTSFCALVMVAVGRQANTDSLTLADRKTGVPPLMEDSESSGLRSNSEAGCLSAHETTGRKPVVHDRLEAYLPPKLTVLAGRSLGSWRWVAAWQLSVLVMIVVLAAMGWREGGEISWMTLPAGWRTISLQLRAVCGGVMLAASLTWLNHWKKS